jgi:hypothetical protein
MATTQTERALHRAPTSGGTKGRKIGAWIATGIFAAMFVFSGALFLAGPPDVAANFHHLGYPDYFRRLLGVAKLLGVAALVLPLPTPVLREWAYAGLTFTCLGAAFSHTMSGDAFGKVAPSLFALAILMTSYVLRRRVARDERATT